jgi:hypothetical protein
MEAAVSSEMSAADLSDYQISIETLIMNGKSLSSVPLSLYFYAQVDSVSWYLVMLLSFVMFVLRAL